MNRELIAVIDEIGRQRNRQGPGHWRDRVRASNCRQKAIRPGRKHPGGNRQQDGEISVVSKKIIVDTVANPKAEISLKEAREYDEGAEVGDEIGSLIEMDELGRIAAQTAKQVIFQKVREAEWEAVQKSIRRVKVTWSTGLFWVWSGGTSWSISARPRRSCPSRNRSP